MSGKHAGKFVVVGFVFVVAAVSSTIHVSPVTNPRARPKAGEGVRQATAAPGSVRSNMNRAIRVQQSQARGDS